MNRGKSPSEQPHSVEAQQLAEIEQLQSQAAATPAPVSTPPGPPSSASSQDRISQLKELAELKKAGILTEEEFQQEKARILNS
jgi:hypothetical protein